LSKSFDDMWHATYMQGNQGDSWLLVVASQISSLIFGPSFGHNLCFKYPNGSCKPISDIYILKYFQWYQELSNPMSFDLYNCPLKIRDSHSQNGGPLGNVWVHSLTLSYIHVNMKCVSRALFLAHTFANLCLDCEPKARDTTTHIFIIF